MGGLDTVGVHCGMDIIAGVRKHLTADLNEQRAQELTRVDFDVHDTLHPWWVPQVRHSSIVE